MMPAHSQPKITYDPAAAVAAGLTVTFGNDPLFMEAARPFLQHPKAQFGDLTPLMPYGVVLTNTSSKAIAMFSVIYERVYTGRPWPSNTGTIAINTRNSDGVANFGPGQSVLIFPGVSLVGPITALRQSIIDQEVKVLEGVTSVRLVVDGVIFEDGLLFGPDRHGLAVRYDAERQAIRDVLQEAQKIPANEDFQQYVQGLASLQLPQLASVAEPLRDGAFYYQRMRQRLGKSLQQRTADPDSGLAWLARVHQRYANSAPNSQKGDAK